MIVVPDGPEGVRSLKILFPEHVTVRAHDHSEQEHLYMFRGGIQGDSPAWKDTDNALEYARDFGQIHFVARATLKDDGVVFHYEFTNHSRIDYDMVRDPGPADDPFERLVPSPLFGVLHGAHGLAGAKRSCFLQESVRAFAKP